MALKTSVTDDDKVYQNGSTSREVVASYWNDGVNIKVYDDVATVVEEYHGLSETAAKNLVATSKANNMADYRIRSSSTLPYSQIICPQAKGSKVNAAARRNGNSRMFTVTVTTETHACSNSAGWGEF